MEPTSANPFDLPEGDNDTLMGMGLGQDLVDLQLTMLYPGQPHERPPDPFSMNSSFVWDTPMDGSLSPLENAVPSQDDAVDLTAVADPLDTTSPSSTANLSPRRTSKASRISSKSSVPSLSSTPQPPEKRVRKPSRKMQEQQALPSVAPAQVKNTSGGEENAKRTKYLERNRIAASKCRQKKKEWTHELEESKTKMESEHVELQREYGILLGEVSMIKNLLMRHAGCKDPNIDQWIELEAKKFVQKPSHNSEEASAAHRLSLSLLHSASASASRRASLAGEDSHGLWSGRATANSVSESLNPLSPAPSPVVNIGDYL
jgi:hypothetical protein